MTTARRRRNRAPLTKEEATLVLALFNTQGLSKQGCAKALDCNVSVVTKILRYAADNNGEARVPRMGQNKKSDPR